MPFKNKPKNMKTLKPNNIDKINTIKTHIDIYIFGPFGRIPVRVVGAGPGAGTHPPPGTCPSSPTSQTSAPPSRPENTRGTRFSRLTNDQKIKI